MVVTPTDPVTLCPLCPTDWAPVEFPSTQRRAFIERELLQIPGWRLSAPAREWTPSMTNLQLRERVVRALEIAATLQPGEQVRALSIGAARVWTVGEILTAANENTHISDVLDDLAGRNGPVELVDSLEVADGTGRFLRLPKGATTTRPAHAAGRARFNTTKNLPEFSDGSAWREMGNAPELTYETLNAANDVGTGASQVSRGNHTHIPGQVAAPTVESVSGENNQLEVSWVAPFAGSTAITSYTVAYSLAGENIWTEETSTNRTHTIDGLSPNANYDVRIAAVNTTGTGPWSPVTSARTNDGRMYGLFGVRHTNSSASSSGRSVLATIDLSTPTLIPTDTQIHPGSPTLDYGSSMAWFQDTMYLLDRTRLRSVDLATGEISTLIGTVIDLSNRSEFGRGMATDGTTLYAVIAILSGSFPNRVTTGDTGIYTIDPSTGAGTAFATSTVWTDCVDIVFHGTTWFALFRTRLYTVNPTTGARTSVGSTFSDEGYNGLVSDGVNLYTINSSTRSLYIVPQTGGAPSLVGDSGALGTPFVLGAFVPA